MLARGLESAGTIWDYLTFRRAIPDSGGRSYVLLPRLPVTQLLLTESP